MKLPQSDPIEIVRSSIFEEEFNDRVSRELLEPGTLYIARFIINRRNPEEYAADYLLTLHEKTVTNQRKLFIWGMERLVTVTLLEGTPQTGLNVLPPCYVREDGELYERSKSKLAFSTQAYETPLGYLLEDDTDSEEAPTLEAELRKELGIPAYP